MFVPFLQLFIRILKEHLSLLLPIMIINFCFFQFSSNKIHALQTAPSSRF